jgi:hypothetical protein
MRYRSLIKSGTDLKQSELLLGDGSESRVLNVSFKNFYNFYNKSENYEYTQSDFNMSKW